MTRSLRILFLAPLWALSLWPLLLLALAGTSPAAAVRAADRAAVGGGWLLWGLLLAALVALVALPPSVPGLKLLLRRLRTQLGTPERPLAEARARLQHLETVDDHLTIGRSLLNRGNTRAALPHLARAVELDGSHASARFQLVSALASIGAHEAVVAHAGALLVVDERHAGGRPLLLLARALAAVGRTAEALAAVERFHRIGGETPESLLLLARLQAAAGQPDASRDSLARAAAPPPPGTPDPLDHQWFRSRARVRRWLGGFR